MALNSFRRRCANILSAVLRLVLKKNTANADVFLAVGEKRQPEIRLRLQATLDDDYAQDFCFYHKTKRKAGDKTLVQRFLKEFKATCKTSGETEL